MHKELLVQLIKNKWTKNVFKQWDIVFNEWDIEKKLYFVDKWKIVIEKDWNPVIELSLWELIWEKTFLEWTKKTVSAKVLENQTEIYTLTYEDFEKIDSSEKLEILKNLCLLLSERIYKLNTIMSLIMFINNKIYSFSQYNDYNYIKDLLNKFIELRWFVILKYEDDSFYNVYADMQYDEKIEWFIRSLVNEGNWIKIWQNYLYLRSWEFIYLFTWDIKIENYILVNSLMYADTMFKFLGDTLLRNKESVVLDNIETI